MNMYKIGSLAALKTLQLKHAGLLSKAKGLVDDAVHAPKMLDDAKAMMAKGDDLLSRGEPLLQQGQDVLQQGQDVLQRGEGVLQLSLIHI